MKSAAAFSILFLLTWNSFSDISGLAVTGDQSKSTPIFRESNGIYTMNIKIGTPAQELKVALSHLQDPFLVSTACGPTCSGRTLYNLATSTTSSTSADGKNLNTDFGEFNGTQAVSDQTEIAGTKKKAKWNLAESAKLPSGTSHVGILPVTGSNHFSLENLASSSTANKVFAINFASDPENVGTGRLWMGKTDPNIPLDSVKFLDVLKFQGFSMMRFSEGQLGDTKLSCKLGPKVDCDATLDFASNFSTLGRRIDDIATSLALTKRANKFIVECNKVHQLPNFALKINNNQQIIFTPQQYVVKERNQGTEECFFGFVNSGFKDFKLGLNLLRHVYMVYNETMTEGNVKQLRIGFHNAGSN